MFRRQTYARWAISSVNTNTKYILSICGIIGVVILSEVFPDVFGQSYYFLALLTVMLMTAVREMHKDSSKLQ